MCANGLLIIRCQFILLKIKLNAFFSVKKKPTGAIYNNDRVRQFHILEYLGCFWDATLSGEPMAMKYLNTINAKLQSL